MAMLSSWRWRAKALLFLLIAAGVGAVWFGLAHDRAASPLVVAASSAAPAGGPAVPVTEGRAETRDVPIWLSGLSVPEFDANAPEIGPSISRVPKKDIGSFRNGPSGASRNDDVYPFYSRPLHSAGLG